MGGFLCSSSSSNSEGVKGENIWKMRNRRLLMEKIERESTMKSSLGERKRMWRGGSRLGMATQDIFPFLVERLFNTTIIMLLIVCPPFKVID